MTSLTMQNTPDDDVIDQKPKPQTENFCFHSKLQTSQVDNGQGRIQPVSLGGAISVIFGGQVSFTGSLL